MLFRSSKAGVTAMELNVVLLWVECVIHFATFLVVFLYNEHHSRQRWGVSLFAIGIAASNIGLAVLLALGALKMGPMAHALFILAFGCVLGLLVRAGGNVAKIVRFPKQGVPL